MSHLESSECIARIRALLTELRFLTSASTVGDAESLFDAAVLDSLRLMELIPLLEQQFSIRVAVEDLTPDNFDSLTSISRYVMERRA
ncbi:MAG: acyl carrier protein [Steroidobacteraceae bacterium]|nr:acyl carrier protein [Nevskiaceae bacterium]